jgi:hypothetical protein
MQYKTTADDEREHASCYLPLHDFGVFFAKLSENEH